MSKSTGPRTPSGKKRSSRNAAKHLITSRRILPGEEEQVAILHSGLAEYFKPQGLIEHEIIVDITINRLHKYRIDAAFTREFSIAYFEKAKQHGENFERAIAQCVPGDPILPVIAAQRGASERAHPSICIGFLETLRNKINDSGPDPEEDLATLLACYGDQPPRYVALAMHKLGIEKLLRVARQTKQGAPADAPDAEKVKQRMLELLGLAIAHERILESDELSAEVIEFAGPQEPPPGVLDVLIRYRSFNMREFDSLLASLERVRRLQSN